MAIALYYLILILTGVGLFCVWKFLGKKLQPKETLTLKWLSLVLAAVFCLRYFWGGEMLSGVSAFKNSPFESPFLTGLATIAVWLEFAAVVVMMVYPFFKDQPIMVHFVKFFALPVGIFSVFTLIPQIIGMEGGAAIESFSVRQIFMCMEIAIIVMYSLYVFLTNGRFKASKQLWIMYACLILPLILSVTPSYGLKVFLGEGSPFEKVKGFTAYHRFLLYLSVIIPAILYFLLRNRKKEFIRLALVVISLGTCISFCRGYTFADILHPPSWPLHLCNTAMFLVPLCLIFRLEKLFYFTLFINVFGAFIAMVMPNYENVYMFSNRIMGFWTNHFCAFFMPILICALKVYERPKLKHFKYSMIGFFMYYALVLVLNAWFSNFGECDFFYINSDFVAEKLGKWAEKLRDIVVSFNIGDLKFTFYPLYQALYFLVYGLLGLSMWFVFEQFFTIADTHYDIRQRKKKIKADQLALMSQLNGRSIEEPMNEQNKDKLIIRDLTKRYSTSDVYAVYKANLEVHAGEIFGFLGPNGAGKSTIIKSIVGIQPVTGGEIEVCGFDTEKQSVMAKRQIGFVPDHYALYEKLSGREYINYIADLYDVSKEDRDARIKKYVELFELEGAFDNQMKTYSHGMKQKITIIAALVHNPKVWILDEPLTGLDPTSIFQVKECMKNHAKEGNIVFFSSHIIDVVERICDRITIIKKGQICATKTIQELDEEGINLEEYYLSIIENEDTDAIVVGKEPAEVADELAELEGDNQTAETEVKEEPVEENAEVEPTEEVQEETTEEHVEVEESAEVEESTQEAETAEETEVVTEEQLEEIVEQEEAVSNDEEVIEVAEEDDSANQPE